MPEKQSSCDLFFIFSKDLCRLAFITSNRKIRNMQDIQDNMPLWYCIKTRPRQERVAKRGLQIELNIDVFCPLLRFERARRSGRVRVIEAMFPGYIFAKFLYNTHHRRVATTKGVSNLVAFGGFPAVVPEEVIQDLKAILTVGEIAEVSPEVQVGKEVRILEGPFRGIRALVTQVMPAQSRVKILLELLGMEREVEVSEHDVLPDTRHPMSTT